MMEGGTFKERVLVLGATGFIGSRLVKELIERDVGLRLLVRDPSKAARMVSHGSDVQVIKGDILSAEGLGEALEGIHTAFYLVHSMGGRSVGQTTDFVGKDHLAARNFVRAADKSGLKRVIYLGGLGEARSELSEHLKSRAEVARILSSGKTEATVLRAAVIIGAGGSSFEILRHLVERLPVMVCPKWIETRIQPIYVGDVVQYLVGCLLEQKTAGGTFDIGGPDVMTYREMMQKYAEARGLARRLIITVPVLTPLLSAYWVDLVTPIPSGIAHPLIEGMRNEVVCRDNRIDELVPIRKTPFIEAVKKACAEETTGPGVTGF